MLWSDIPNDENLRYIEEDDHVSRRFRYPSGNSNGNTFDYEGRQIACQHGTRKVVRYEHNGKTTVVADKFEGQEFNAPNDVVVNPNDGAIWFTDPGYGSLMEYEGNRLPGSASSVPPLRKEAVYRIDKSGTITKVAEEPFKPNGLCFSNDYRKLYIADTGISHYPDAKSVIWVYDVDGATLKNPKTFINMEWNGKTGFADGIRCDEEGNVWTAAGWVGDGYDGVTSSRPTARVSARSGCRRSAPTFALAARAQPAVLAASQSFTDSSGTRALHRDAMPIVTSTGRVPDRSETACPCQGTRSA